MINGRLDPKAFASVEYASQSSSMHVSAAELCHFEENQDRLAELIGKRKIRYTKEHGYTYEVANERLEEECCIAADTMKKTITMKIKCSRNFLYKFTVGLHMSLEEANEYFRLCDGELRPDCMADYICIRALEDKDPIDLFIKEFEKHTGIKLARRERKR